MKPAICACGHRLSWHELIGRQATDHGRCSAWACKCERFAKEGD